MHITGKAIPMKKSIQVLFVDDDPGAIVAHTCSNQIMFPRVSFPDTEEAFQNFVLALKAVIASPLSFNMV